MSRSIHHRELHVDFKARLVQTLVSCWVCDKKHEPLTTNYVRIATMRKHFPERDLYRRTAMFRDGLLFVYVTPTIRTVQLVCPVKFLKSYRSDLTQRSIEAPEQAIVLYQELL